MDCAVVITANGKGERMKGVSNLPKFELIYQGRSILDNLLTVFPDAFILSHYPLVYKLIRCEATNSRKETLQYIKNWTDVLIVDCDIIVPEFDYEFKKDTVFYKNSNKEHYEKIKDNMVTSGLYFVKSVEKLLEKMNDNSILSGMEDPEMVELETIHLGTPKDYFDSI